MVLFVFTEHVVSIKFVCVATEASTFPALHCPAGEELKLVLVGVPDRVGEGHAET